MRYPFVLTAALAVLLAAPAAAQVSTPSVPIPVRTTTHAWTLTPSGFGPVRIGMSRAEVNRALGVTLTPARAAAPTPCRA